MPEEIQVIHVGSPEIQHRDVADAMKEAGKTDVVCPADRGGGWMDSVPEILMRFSRDFGGGVSVARSRLKRAQARDAMYLPCRCGSGKKHRFCCYRKLLK